MQEHNDRFIDFMRFFFLGLAIALLILLAVIGYGVYRSSTREIGDSDVVIVDDTEAITMAELETESESDTELMAQTELPTGTESTAQMELSVETELPAQTDLNAQTESSAQTELTAGLETAAGSAEAETTGEEETETEEESTGDYRTLLQACNFRSEAAYEDEDGNDTTIGSCAAGTEVELLEDLGGWAKVRIDGVVGYVGSQFISSAE